MGLSSSQPKTSPPLLLEPCMAGDIDKVRELLDIVEDVNDCTGGNAAIHGAVFAGHLAIVQLLATNGANLSLPNTNLLCTPVWLAAGYGHTEVLTFLLDQLADDNDVILQQTNSTGDTPLLAASSKGHAGCCKLLLQRCTAAKDIVNRANDSPLSVGLDAGLPTEILSLLLSPKVNTLVNTKKLTPLLIACERNRADMVKLLLEQQGVDPLLVVDGKGDSILAVSAFCGSTDCVRYLVQQQQYASLLNQANTKTQCSPLWLAVRAGHTESVQALLEANADRNIMDTTMKLSPLELAKKYERSKIVELLQQDNHAT